MEITLRPHPGDRLCAPVGHADRHHRQQRHPVCRIGPEGRAFHRAVLPAAHAADLPAEHHRLHGRPQGRAGRHRQARRQDGDGGGRARRCPSSRSSSAAASAPATTPCAAAPTARASCGCGPTRASASWAASRQRACWQPCERDGIEAKGGRLERGRGGGIHGADPRAVRDAGPSLLRHRPPLG